MQPIPYIFFNGTCREALTSYGAIFGTSPEFMLAGDMPPGEMDIPDDRKDWIMHGSLKVGDGTLFASDNIMGESAKMDGCSVMIEAQTRDEAKGYFDKLADGGDITMPFSPTFWSAGFGMIRDRFGMSWMVGCHEGGPDA